MSHFNPLESRLVTAVSTRELCASECVDRGDLDRDDSGCEDLDHG
jgi:hypothetical protein